MTTFVKVEGKFRRRRRLRVIDVEYFVFRLFVLAIDFLNKNTKRYTFVKTQ